MRLEHFNSRLLKIFLAAALMLSSQIAFAIDVSVSGSLRAKLERKDTDNNISDDAFGLEDAASRFRVKAHHDMEGIRVFGNIEYGSDVDTKNSGVKLRQGYFGLSGDFGQISGGTQTFIWHSFVRSGVFEDFGSGRFGPFNSINKTVFTPAVGTTPASTATSSESAQINYWYNKNNKKGPFTLAAGALLADGNDDESVDVFNVGAQYKSKAFKLQGAVLSEKASMNQNATNPNGTDGNLVGLRGWLYFDALTLAAWHHSAENGINSAGGFAIGGATNDSTATALFAQYAVKPNHEFRIQHVMLEADNVTAEPTITTIEYVRKFKDYNARYWLAFESTDWDMLPGKADTDIAQVGFRFDF